MSRSLGRPVSLAALIALAAGGAGWAAQPQDIERLRAEFGPAAEVTLNPATGAARFVRLPAAAAARAGGPQALARQDRSPEQRAAAFLRTHGGLFGLSDPDTELQVVDSRADHLGGRHLTYAQRHRGVPVFAATLKAHFDAAGDLRAVNGVTVPGLAVDVAARHDAQQAGRAALAWVQGQGKGAGLAVRASQLYVYRAGLIQGVAGPSHLAWQVEVGNGTDVREFVFVDAHSGKVVDEFTGVYDALFRRAYNGGFLNGIPPSYPASPFWVEGDPFPTASTEANNMLLASQETYDLFSNAFGRDSWDGAGAIMDQIFNRGYSCPNASWNGRFISFCAGFTTDDVTAHEWGHAYTERTHGLIYAWQPGALNESYSDIFGETVDRINARGTNDPGPARTADGSLCSEFTLFPVEVRVNAPGGIAADYAAGAASFGPYPTSAGTTGDLAYATPADGCTAITNDLTGKVALVDRGVCPFVIKVKNAQNAGAIAVVIADNTGGNAVAGMSGADPTIVIPSVRVSQNTGILLKNTLLTDAVNVTVRQDPPPATDPSNRWLMGEDVNAVGLVGALRDMWNPGCYGNPGHVTDDNYFCGTGDNGGVHLNSGVPNHAYALLVDGGIYNGQTINAIGLTKAAHVYFRAMSVYQHPATDFAEHADALEQSCQDLAAAGTDLHDLATGLPSGEVVGAADCAEVAKAMLAVEMRTPNECGFLPLLAKNPPDRCEAGTVQADVFFDDFETDPIGPWTATHTAAVPADFTPRDWAWVTGLPDREGSAVFGIDYPGGTCAPGGDESGVLHLTSPVIALPPGAANPRLTFDHWVATETAWDGGNLKISVNGGPWQLVAAADFTYNAYNMTLATVAQENTNPLAGQPAFSGSDGGAVDGSWGRSHVNLAPYAVPGDTVQLQFDMGTDGCSGTFGWIVDDPTVYACVPPGPPAVSINDVSVVEGNSGWVEAELRISLSQPSAEPVTVWYLTLPYTALPFTDFELDLDAVTIAPLQLEKTIRVKVRGDRKREPNELFYVHLFLSDGGTIADAFGAVTIVNDDTSRH